MECANRKTVSYLEQVWRPALSGEANSYAFAFSELTVNGTNFVGFKDDCRDCPRMSEEGVIMSLSRCSAYEESCLTRGCRFGAADLSWVGDGASDRACRIGWINGRSGATLLLVDGGRVGTRVAVGEYLFNILCPSKILSYEGWVLQLQDQIS